MSGLFNSSIGRKLVMSITGVCLVLFLTFHMCMNLVAVFSAEGYNMVCEFLGANWYAVVATVILAAGFLIHIVYAFILTMRNKAARGNSSYAVTAKPAGVEWASQNMLVLGLIVLAGLVLHGAQFWYKMMFAELMGAHEVMVCGATEAISCTDGAGFIAFYFSHLWVVIAYVVWLAALWFHLNHGFWSALHTLGWNNLVWIERLKKISVVYSTIICLGFALVVVGYYFGLFPLM